MLDIIHPDHPDRADVEAFIHQVFERQYEADIHHFMPNLVRLRYDRDGRVYSVAGFRPALEHPLFVEKYFDQPIESVFSRVLDEHFSRDQIVEVGNLAEAGQGGARDAIIALISFLYGAGYKWGVATIVPKLKNAFLRVGLTPIELGIADIGRLSREEQQEWGSYYANHPVIAAMDIRMAFHTLELYVSDFPPGCLGLMQSGRQLGLHARRAAEQRGKFF